MLRNVELVPAISTHYNILKFQVDKTIIFELSCTHTDRYTHTNNKTATHTDGHEYSIVAVDKPQL